MSSIALETPLAESLSNSVHAKIVEQGWTQEDDTSLAEYIVLMLANGKTQEQIASELAGELLQDPSGTDEFASWLFKQVADLTGDGNVGDDNLLGSGVDSSAQGEDVSVPAAYETDMTESAPDNAYVKRSSEMNLGTNTGDSPRGPKGLHGGRGGARGGRGSGKAGDSVLHRTRGNDRINSHMRGTPKGPRGGGRDNRAGMQKALNGMMGQAGQAPMMPNGSQQNMMQISPQQQMEFMAMMEQQARMMAQFIPGMAQGMNGSFPGGQQNANGRSLFDRVDGSRGRGGGRGRGRGGIVQNSNMRKNNDDKTEESQAGDESSQMDVESTTTGQAPTADPSSTVCYFNLRCTNQSCPYVHQSSAAPEGITIDMTNECSFGSACRNSKCNGKHPSPATKRAHQAEELCKFFPNCANPVCPFKHPSMPLCSFGASCKNKDCRFTHLTTKCRYNPCMNARCPYQHDDGQNKTMDNYTWTAESAKQSGEDQSQDHVSNRKFVVDEGEEELIKPGQNTDSVQQQAGEVIT